MKTNIIIFISLFLLSSCQSMNDYKFSNKNTSLNKYYTESFTFYNSSDRNKLLSLKAFTKTTKYEFIKNIIIVENQMNSKDFKNYKTMCENYMVVDLEPRMLCYQNEELEALRFFNMPENYIIINATNNKNLQEISSYYTDINTTNSLQNKHKGFRITILNAKNGEILLQSEKPIDAQKLVKILKDNN